MGPGLAGLHLILIIQFCQFTTNFPEQNHFDSVCENMTEELLDPPRILSVSYADIWRMVFCDWYHVIGNFLSVPI